MYSITVTWNFHKYKGFTKFYYSINEESKSDIGSIIVMLITSESRAAHESWQHRWSRVASWITYYCWLCYYYFFPFFFSVSFSFFGLISCYYFENDFINHLHDFLLLLFLIKLFLKVGTFILKMINLLVSWLITLFWKLFSNFFFLIL